MKNFLRVVTMSMGEFPNSESSPIECISVTLDSFSESCPFLLCDTCPVNVLGKDLLFKLGGQIKFFSGERTLEFPDSSDTEVLLYVLWAQTDCPEETMKFHKSIDAIDLSEIPDPQRVSS